MQEPRNLSTTSSKVNEVSRRYGSIEDFLLTFSPDKQMTYCAYEDKCFFGTSPTLGKLNNAYGKNAASAWLVPQLVSLSEYCGCKDKLTDMQLRELAMIIATKYGYLKVTELMLFFYWLKSGIYGRFYGVIDPMVITTSLLSFIAVRSEIKTRKEQEEYERRMEESAKRAITHEEYLKRKEQNESNSK